jgi:hypothetical protein
MLQTNVNIKKIFAVYIVIYSFVPEEKAVCSGCRGIPQVQSSINLLMHVVRRRNLYPDD